MTARLQRVWLVILVCILPMQSMAAALAPFTCAPQHSHEAAVLHDVTHSHAVAAHGHGVTHDGDTGHEHSGDAVGHLCCHQFSSAAPSFSLPAAPSDFRVYGSTVALLTPLHIPELPQRPPRG